MTRDELKTTRASTKGKKLSPEHRAKISAANMGNKSKLGQKYPPETCAKISAAQRGSKNHNWGKRASLKTREKMRVARLGKKLPPRSASWRASLSIANKGKKLSPETRAKISVAMKGKLAGDKHPMWRGGISRLPYDWTFNAELKEEVRRRDGHKCQWCGVPQSECKKPLNVHHINYNKNDSDPLNLVSLCAQCHGRTNMRRQHWKKVLSLLLMGKNNDPR